VKQETTVSPATEFRCAMGRWEDVMLVRPVGQQGMSFVFSDDLSVILAREDQVRLRDLLNARLGECKR
jgi:hypothetical protein